MDTVMHNGIGYPFLQAEGNAAQFAMPFAIRVCKGTGYDIGCANEEWKLPGATGIDLEYDDPWHATNLPDGKVDYIFSSHCLEHVDDWVGTLEYWTSKLKRGGHLFLYLPHYDQSYWRPWHNRKHKHVLDAEQIRQCLLSFGFNQCFITGKDLNYSFYVVGKWRH